MRPAGRLYQACRITLFVRDHCGLCTRAKSALSHVWETRPFVYNEVDVIQPEFRRWRDLYDMDVPVVRTRSPPPVRVSRLCSCWIQVHISRADSAEEDPSLASKAVKLMHRFTPEDIQAKMDEVEKTP